VKKDNIVFIRHIKDAIELIINFTKNYDNKRFVNDVLIQSAVVRQIEIIGEAVKNLTPEFKRKYPQIPWRDIIGMRDKLIHQYFGVDLNRVWNVVKKDLAVLKAEIKNILEIESGN